MFVRNRITRRGVLIALAGLALVMSVACGKKSGADKALSAEKEAAKEAAGTFAPSNANAQNDYAKPFLTEEKLTRFIESLQEDVNPFEVLFKGGAGGQMMNMSEIEKRAQEFNGFARKYGFADFGDYTAVWGRILVGDMMIASEQMKKDLIKGMEESIQSAEENLKKPDLSPDMRSIYEEQIKSARETIEESQKPDDTSGLNAADQALVAKYKPQIDEAAKKFNKNPGN